MIKRYLITLGATTTAGGAVTSASSMLNIDGIRVALERDTVFCKACLSNGFIKADGPRLGDRYNGREFALTDDLCICKCDPPPRLVHNQTLRGQTIAADWHAARAAAAHDAAATLNAAGRSTAAADMAPLLLRDVDTREPLRERPYRLEHSGGVIEGTTDASGMTRPLTAAERAAVLAWDRGGADGQS